MALFSGTAFRALACAITPEARQLDARGWSEVERIVESALDGRPHALRLQLGVLLSALEWVPVLRWGRRLSSLDAESRARFLAAVEDAPVLLLRRGFWGVRTLVFMGFYGRKEAAEEIGYRASAQGWEARR
jgi:hypothetical protein